MKTEKSYQSIFDFYFNSIDVTSRFDWESPPKNMKLTIQDIIMEGKLVGDNQDSEAHYYVATTSMLVRFSVYYVNVTCKLEEDPKPEAVLYLRFSILDSIGYFGFSLKANNKMFIFYTSVKEEASDWFNKLRRYSHVVLNEIQNYFLFQKQIGSGSYSKVHVATSNDSKIKYAIKITSKKKLYANRRTLVI